MVFFPKTKNIGKLILHVIAAGYLAQKICYKENPFEKHLCWLGFNIGYGSIIGQLAMQNATMRNKYMDLFAIYGYAMIYVAAYCFKTEFDR